MKNLLILLISLPIVVFGQIKSDGYDISTSKPYEVVDARSKYYFSQGDNVLMLKIQRKEIIIQKYNVIDKKLTKRKSFPMLEKGAVIESMNEIDDNYYLFYSLWDKPNETEQLFYKIIDFEKSTLGKSVNVTKIKGKITGSFANISTSNIGFGLMGFSGWSMGVVDKFSFSESFDESNFVIQYRKKPKTRNDKFSYDEIGMLVFDPEMNEIWSGEFKMPYTEAEMNNIDYDVDSKGNAYILTEVYDSDISKRYVKGEKNYHLEILKIKDSNVEKIKIDEENYHINDIWMHEGSENNIYLTGYYNEEKGYYKDIDGIFLMKLNQDGSIETSVHHKIPLEVINQYKKARTQNKNAKKSAKGKLDFEDIIFREISLGEDGSTILVGEQYYVKVYTDSKGRKRYTYHYEDILVTKLDSDGELMWMKKLPKRQKGAQGRGQMGYEYIYHNGNNYFFYVDNDKNIDLGIDELPKVHMDGLGGVLTAYKINDETGKVSKSSVVDLKLAPVKGNKPMPIYQFSTGRIIETSKGMVFEVYKKGKEDVMVHVEFE
jgi:hypothetical protein